MKFKIKKSIFYKVMIIFYLTLYLSLLYTSYTRSSLKSDRFLLIILFLALVSNLHNFIFKKYILDNEKLKIYTKRIYFDDIISVTKSSKLFTPFFTNYSMSRDKLKIEYLDPGGYKREIYISPKDEDLFLEKLYSKVSFSKDNIVESK